MPTVAELLSEIQEKHTQVSSSQKDEISIMQAMLNDTSYAVGVYSTKGKIDTYCPAADFKAMQTNIVSSTTKISKDEARSLVADYQATKSDAAAMVNISKEFVNTYLESGRKLTLGGRADSNYALSAKNVPETKKMYQKKHEDANGDVTWEKCEKVIPAHKGLKTYYITFIRSY